MAKRIIKIILILLAVFFLLLIGMWLLGRHEAVKNGKTTLSFKQFLGLGTPITSPSAQGTLSSVFTGGSSSGSGLSNTATTGADHGLGGSSTAGGTDNTVNVSNFTTDTFSPDTTAFNPNGNVGAGNLSAAGSGIGANAGATTSSTGGIATSGGTTSGSTVGAGGDTANICSSADTTIVFTPQELAQLNALQTQYNQISADLATNDDLATETSNYTTYKLEEGKVAELQNFCSTYTPLITDPAYQRHVPTPFWHDATQDTETYTAGVVNNNITNSDPSNGESFIERILRINLW